MVTPYRYHTNPPPPGAANLNILLEILNIVGWKKEHALENTWIASPNSLYCF